MQSPDKKIKQLERTVMELGTEVFRNRNELTHLKKYHENFVKIIHGLKHMLDEKGMISMEDFDDAIELGEAVAMPTAAETSIEFELDRLKKASH